ncbi:hypothetical protein BGV40_13080 [Methanosarcina sp. Ant1]|nr:hypothetical protein BGV40_13080 [Methanosarcina sp. Ant1]
MPVLLALIFKMTLLRIYAVERRTPLNAFLCFLMHNQILKIDKLPELLERLTEKSFLILKKEKDLFKKLPES